MKTIRHEVKTITCTVLSAMLLSFGVSYSESATDEATSPHKLTGFERLIGSWSLGQSYQTFYWGPGKHSLLADQYSIQESDTTLVSKGLIFFHPGSERIRGYFCATGMGIDLFEYTNMYFAGDTMFTDLTTYGAHTGDFFELWVFTDEDHIHWSLYQKSDTTRSASMDGVYERVKR